MACQTAPVELTSLSSPGSEAVVSVRPFSIEVPEDELADLRERLARTRLPRPTPGEPWSAGVDYGYLAELGRYWREDFDWRAREAELNAFPQYTVEIDGCRVHFLHVRAPRRDGGSAPVPLLLSHGWPSAFTEFLKLAPLLTDDFDLVIPSTPGFVFSDPLSGPHTRAAIADVWAKLMTVLGYDRFGAYGGDIGADITNWLAIRHPERLLGIHLLHPKMPSVGPSDPPLDAQEQAFLDSLKKFDETDFGYSAMQETRPDTAAAALNDSPIGLAAWILDKFRAWTDHDGDLESRFSRDDLLTLVTLYWVTGCIGSSFRTYFDYHYNEPRPAIGVPVAATLGIEDREYPRQMADRSYTDVRRWRAATVGGHFLPLEEPELLADELRAFFGEVAARD
jgi:pimeloyl-ACP methyl ester carboxylesterase